MKKNKLAAIFLIVGLFAGCTAASGGVPAAVKLSAVAVDAPQSNPAVAELFADDDISGEITVSRYDIYNAYAGAFGKAAQEFEAKHPNTKINIVNHASPPEFKQVMIDGVERGMMVPGGGPQEQADYITQTNVEIMSGRAADVFSLDVLPFYKYTASGSFENFRDYMAADEEFNPDDYRTSVFDALTVDGVLGVMPIEFLFTFASYDATLFTEEEQAELDSLDGASYEELVELGKDVFARANEASGEAVYMFDPYTSGQFVSRLFNENHSTFLDVPDKRAAFDDGKFAELLKTVKSYEDAGYLAPSGAEAERVLFKVGPNYGMFRLFSDDEVRRNRVDAISASNDEDDKLIGILKNANGEATFDLGRSVAMNANSQNKRLAWEFIKYLLSYEVQASALSNQITMHKAAYGELMNLWLTGRLMMAEDAVDELDEHGQSELDAYLAAVDELVARINTYYIKDAEVTQIIDAELGDYAENRSRTPEDTGSAIQNKLFLYLNE